MSRNPAAESLRKFIAHAYADRASNGAAVADVARRRREHDEAVRDIRASGLILSSLADFLTGVIFGLLLALAVLVAVFLWL